jgi:hypothetical protein
MAIDSTEAIAAESGARGVSRPTLAIIGAFAAVVLGAAFIAVGPMSGPTEPDDTVLRLPPMQVGDLTVHGPLEVRGQLVVRGSALVRGPLSALRIEQVTQPSVDNPQGSFAPRVVGGPMEVDRTLIVNGDLRVDGPLHVGAVLITSGGITTNGPLEERADD